MYTSSGDEQEEGAGGVRGLGSDGGSVAGGGSVARSGLLRSTRLSQTSQSEAVEARYKQKDAISTPKENEAREAARQRKCLARPRLLPQVLGCLLALLAQKYKY